MPRHPALEAGRTAVVTGAASGIGRATAVELVRMGLDVCLCDLPGAALDEATAQADAAGSGGAIGIPVDVSRPEEVQHLADTVFSRSGDVAFLMNNAGIEAGGRFDSPLDTWRRIIDVNLWGAIHGIQAFLPRMQTSGRPAAIVNTGSKQGITTPPGNTPYNVSKAGLKVVTEALAHELRSAAAPITAHLLIPGFVFTGLTRARGVQEKPAGAWTPEETVAFMVEALGRGDFYILCPDNDVPRELDEKRILWAAGDIAENRSALSRWDPRYTDAFAAYIAES